MPQIIDALVVELGLDVSKFTAGQKQALEAFKKTQEEAKKRGAEQEDMARKFQGTLGKVRNQAVALVAALAGASTVTAFVANVNTTNAALDRSARILQTNVEKLSLWRKASLVAGGTEEGMQRTIAGLTNEFQRWATTGQSAILPYLRELKIEIADAKGNMKPFQDILFQIIDKASQLDPARAGFLLRAIGVDDEALPLLLKGRVAVDQIIEEVKKLGIVTGEAATKATALETQWSKATVAVQGFFSKWLQASSPSLEKLLHGVERIFTLGGRIFGGGASNERVDTPTSEPLRSSLRSKPGAGTMSLGIAALAHSLQSSVPGLEQFTSFNDRYHQNTGSKHASGLALDFTISDPKKAGQTASAMRERLRELGVNGTVLDEYNNPSANSTGGHIHVQFNNPAAADRFRTGAGAAAGFGASRGGGTTSIQTNIDTINVVTQGKNASEIARDIRPILESRSQASQAQSGPQ